MLSFSHLSLADGVPIYQQILRYVKLGIAGGTIAHGEELPSRRVVSALLGVNPNTGPEGLPAAGGGGPYPVPHRGQEHRGGPMRRPRAGCGGNSSQAEVRDTIAAMKHMGLSRQEALALVDQLWKEGETP